MTEVSGTRSFERGDRVICTNNYGGRWHGSVLRVFRNGRVLADVGTGKRLRPGGRIDRDVRAFDADKVERAVA